MVGPFAPHTYGVPSLVNAALTACWAAGPPPATTAPRLCSPPRGAGTPAKLPAWRDLVRADRFGIPNPPPPMPAGAPINRRPADPAAHPTHGGSRRSSHRPHCGSSPPTPRNEQVGQLSSSQQRLLGDAGLAVQAKPNTHPARGQRKQRSIESGQCASGEGHTETVLDLHGWPDSRSSRRDVAALQAAGQVPLGQSATVRREPAWPQ